jgi:hypothetical protein
MIGACDTLHISPTPFTLRTLGTQYSLSLTSIGESLSCNRSNCLS